MPILILPIGISGSGKTTWSLSMMEKGYKLVQTDGLRKELMGTIQFNPERNHEINREAEKRVMQFLGDGNSIILDATNLNTSVRRDLITNIRNMFPDIRIVYKLFTPDIDVSEQRIQKDLKEGVERSPVTREVLEMQMHQWVDTLEKLKEERIGSLDE